jgi:hypothetical protein
MDEKDLYRYIRYLENTILDLKDELASYESIDVCRSWQQMGASELEMRKVLDILSRNVADVD